MRTDVNVAGQAVLAVVLADVESSLQFSIPKIRDAILKGGFGHTRVTKDFLLPDSRAKILHRDRERRRRKCDALYLVYFSLRPVMPQINLLILPVLLVTSMSHSNDQGAKRERWSRKYV